MIADQVPAWTELDEKNLRSRVRHNTLLGYEFVPVLMSAVRMTSEVVVGVTRLRRGRCTSCELRRVLYRIEVNEGQTSPFCWTCLTGGPEG